MTLTMSLCNNQLALAYKDSSQHDDTNNEVMILVKEARNRTDDQKFAVRFLWQVRTFLCVTCLNDVIYMDTGISTVSSYYEESDTKSY